MQLVVQKEIVLLTDVFDCTPPVVFLRRLTNC
jgi:hypothetical protein